MQAAPWQSGDGSRLSARAYGAIGSAAVGSLWAWDGQALRTRLVWWSALPMLALVPTVAAAQTQTAAAPVAPADQIVEFSADQVIYDSDADVVTASGEVRMNREGNDL